MKRVSLLKAWWITGKKPQCGDVMPFIFCQKFVRKSFLRRDDCQGFRKIEPASLLTTQKETTMRISLFFFLAFVVFIGSVHFAQDKNIASPAGTDWKKDPVCQAVFQAVLEGLQRDHVSGNIVANIIGKKSTRNDRKSLRERMKRSFVLDCPLCEPTFEAFLAYQNGKLPKQNKKPGKSLSTPSQIKSGLTTPEKLLLLSDDTKTRLRGLAPVVQKWVSAKLDTHTELSKQEIADWTKRVHTRSQQGKTKLLQLITKTGNYKEWSPYWGCAACNGSRDAASNWQTQNTKPTKSKGQ